MLNVNPASRPDCQQLLQNPVMLKRMKDAHLQEIDDNELKEEMLRTITIPKNLKFLSETLPKPNYEPLRLRVIEKHRFMNTI
jgi:NIMA (never in mitosis gene a)-related kinase 1/4/5